MKTETLPEPISKAITESGITDLTKAESIAQNYAPIMGAVTEQMQIVKTLKKGDAKDVEKAKRVRIELGKIASAAERQKANDKSILLLETRFIDALYNTVNGAARLTQSEAKEIEEHFERLEAERKAKMQNDREIEVQPFLMENEMHPDYSAMSEDAWTAYMTGKKAIHQMKLDAEAKAESERVAKEKAEAEAREAQRIENERLRAEAIAREKELAEEREKQAKIQQEAEAKQAAIQKAADEKLAEERKKAKAEADRIQAEQDAKLKAEREQREKAEKELADKQESERKARAEKDKADADRVAAEKKAAKAPDKKKIIAAIDALSLAELQLKDPDAQAAYAVIFNKFENFKIWAKEQTTNL